MAGKGLLRLTMMRSERNCYRIGMARLALRRGGGLARLVITDPKTGEPLLSVLVQQCRFVESADPRWGTSYDTVGLAEVGVRPVSGRLVTRSNSTFVAVTVPLTTDPYTSR